MLIFLREVVVVLRRESALAINSSKSVHVIEETAYCQQALQVSTLGTENGFVCAFGL